MTTQEILQHFNKVTSRGSGQWQACCPAHSDKQRSLSIATGKNGKTLITCHAGCELSDILAAAGLKKSDLFNDTGKRPSNKKQFVEEYKYTDTLKKCRYIDETGKKSFIWYSLVNGNWQSGANKQTAPLYNQSILSTVTAGNYVYLVEGEKDVNTLTKHNLPAVCSPNGAGKNLTDSGKKWLDDYTAALTDKDVVILQDNDDIGKSFALAVATKISSAAHSVKIIDLTSEFPELKNHGDISDVAAMYPDNSFIPRLHALIDRTDIFIPDTAAAHKAELIESVKGKKLTNNLFKTVLSIIGIEIKYNLATNRMEITGMSKAYSEQNGPELLPAIIKDFCIQHDIKHCSIENITNHINLVADEHRYNPIHDMFETPAQIQSAAGKSKINQLFELLGIDDKQNLEYFLKWLIQAVALSYNTTANPVITEFVLVLQGPQGIGKTSIFRRLAVNPAWFVEGITIDTNNKDTIINATGGWITEIGELDSTLKKEQTSLKAFITKQTDEIRMPYGRTIVKKARTTCFCATVNDETFLRDATGARRFVIIPLTKIDKQRFFSLKTDWFKDLWREVYKIYKAAPTSYLLSDDDINSIMQTNTKYNCSLPFEDELRDKLDFETDKNFWNVFTATEIKERLMLHKATTQQISRALKAIAKEYPEIIMKRNKKGSRFYVPLPNYQNNALPFVNYN